MFSKTFISLVYLLFALCAGSVYGQVTVDTQAPYNTAASLVENVLLGEGVRASNFTFYGNGKQLGYFSNGKSSVGIENGLILSTGNVEDAAPPQLSAGDLTTAYTPGPNQGAGDADLLKVANLVPKLINQNFAVNPTYDAAILEFDFIPSSDSVVFRYVFASEEYLKWIDTKYNDAFGFFISGPGIDGEYSSPAGFPDSSINIALIPGTIIPITISSINNKRYTNFYINNPQNQNITFNGYTTIFTAVAKVQPCQTYHIKIAIADGSKNDYDSGVLIEARSFSSGNITLEQNIPVISNGAALEGCFASSIVAKRERAKSFNDTIYISVDPSSQATAADLSVLPAYIIIPAGSDSGVVNFSVINDGLTEGLENLLLDFYLKSVCADLHKAYSLDINDAPALQFVQPLDENIQMKCTDSSAFLDGRLMQGYGFYTYSWEADGVPFIYSDSVFYAKPSSTTTYRVTGGDTCNLSSIDKTFTVIPANQSALVLNMPDSIKAPCLGKDYTLFAKDISGGGGVASYAWSHKGSVFSTAKDPVIRPDSSGYYSLQIIDSCGYQAADSSYLSVSRALPIQLTTSSDTTLCSSQSLSLSVTATGGVGNLTYLWSSLNSTSQNVSVTPISTTQYPVTVTDECLNQKTKIVYVKVNEVNADFEYSYYEDFGVEVQNYSIGKELQFNWYLDREAISDEENPRFYLKDLADHKLELQAIDNNGCVDTVEKVILSPLFVYIPTSFTPNGDGINDVYTVQVIDPVEFEMTIFDRWGGEIFTTKDPKKGWTGISDGSGLIVSGSYVVLVKASRRNNIRVEKYGSIILLP